MHFESHHHFGLSSFRMKCDTKFHLRPRVGPSLHLAINTCIGFPNVLFALLLPIYRMKVSYVTILLSLLMLQQGTLCSAVPELVFTISSPNGIECSSTEPRYRDDWQYHIFRKIEKSIESNQGFLYAFRKNDLVKMFVHITVCYNYSANSSSQCSTKPLGIYLWSETFQRLMETLSLNFAMMDFGVLSILTRLIVSSSATITLRRSEPLFQDRNPYNIEISLNATVLCPLEEGFGVERYMEILQLAWEDFIPWVSGCIPASVPGTTVLQNKCRALK